MGIKFDELTKLWIAYYHKRHPITRVPVGLRRVKIASKAEAKRIEAELIVEVEKRIHAKSVPNWRITVERYREGCYERGLAKLTVEHAIVCLNAYTMADWSDRPVDSITTREIRELIEKQVGERSQAQQKKALKFIRGVFNQALEDGTIQRNPAPQMHFRHNEKLKKVLTEDQVRLLLERAKELDWEWYPIWATALYTGMRSGELWALTWDKVNLEARQILVDCAWNSKDGFKSTKSGDDRILEIAPNLVPMLAELKLSGQDAPFVLPRLEEWEKGRQALELRKFLRGLRLPEVRFHDLRATWATVLLSKGVEPIRVMKAGGWKDMKTMMIYVRKAGVDIKGMTDKLDLHNPSRNLATLLSFSK